jgi:regulator of protease activity HflC (stomatin/prohibitin superfamily)
VATLIIVFLLLIGLPVAAGVAVAARPLSSPKLIRRGAFGALAVGVVLSAALLAFKSYHPVDAGHVGIVYGPSGSIVGQMNAGGFIVPWDSVKTLDTRIQRAEYDNLQVYSKETIAATADITVNFHVDPKDARGLIRTVGFNYVTTLMQSRAYNDMKDATVQYAATELAPNRENIRKYVVGKLEAELGRYSIQIDAVQIKNIQLPTTITTPLAKRQAAVINAQAAQNKVKQVVAEAQQKVAAAEGTAKANRAIANSVSTEPGYIAYLKAQAMIALANNPNTKIIPSGVFFTAGDLGVTTTTPSTTTTKP